MSASLVGSEMCIRDSQMATPPCHPPWGPLLAAEYATEASVKRASQMGATVSYTHLTLPTICSV
eukprot:12679527-Alexandrium_andersonii.AAC.1